MIFFDKFILSFKFSKNEFHSKALFRSSCMRTNSFDIRKYFEILTTDVEHEELRGRQKYCDIFISQRYS